MQRRIARLSLGGHSATQQCGEWRAYVAAFCRLCAMQSVMEKKSLLSFWTRAKIRRNERKDWLQVCRDHRAVYQTITHANGIVGI